MKIQRLEKWKFLEICQILFVEPECGWDKSRREQKLNLPRWANYDRLKELYLNLNPLVCINQTDWKVLVELDYDAPRYIHPSSKMLGEFVRRPPIFRSQANQVFTLF